MISAKQVNERAAVARKEIEKTEEAEKIRCRAVIDSEIAPTIEALLINIERTILRATNRGAYATTYSIDIMKGPLSAPVQNAYMEGLLKPLRAAGYNAGFVMDAKEPHNLSIRWEDA